MCGVVWCGVVSPPCGCGGCRQESVPARGRTAGSAGPPLSRPGSPYTVPPVTSPGPPTPPSTTLQTPLTLFAWLVRVNTGFFLIHLLAFKLNRVKIANKASYHSFGHTGVLTGMTGLHPTSVQSPPCAPWLLPG